MRNTKGFAGRFLGGTCGFLFDSCGRPELPRRDADEPLVAVLDNRGLLPRSQMDGRGRALDNVFVERLWRIVKYEDIYIRGYEAVPALQRGLARYFAFYNDERLHESLAYRTPATVYRDISAKMA
jgi:transposase InsO family protein